LELIERYHVSKTFYLIRSTEDTVRSVVSGLKELHPDIPIVGYRNGFIEQPLERIALSANVQEKKLDFVFVAMGFPKQELLMDKLYRVHAATY